MPMLLNEDSVHIREVWKHNLYDEILLIRDIVVKYPYVAMDTEFPGVVIKPVDNLKTRSECIYHTLKENINLLKLIQLGLTFSDREGNLPTCENDKYCVWQFNICEFNINEDVHDTNSIRLLSQSGIDFVKNKEKGISAFDFGELLISSGVVLNDEVHWIVFHGGYDFGYLLKLLIGKNLPDTQEEFFKLIKTYFPNIYDIKHIMKFFGLHGGLKRLAQTVGVERIGSSHQAGSDSLLTCCVFMKLKETVFDGLPEKYAGIVYDLGVEYDQGPRR